MNTSAENSAVNPTEMFPVVDESGEVTGSATRAECHSGSMLLHPVVHLHIIDGHGHVLLQQRSPDKDIQPGKWDTSVGGHVDLGESVTDALLRETREELGLSGITPVHLMDYVFTSDRERELVHVHYLVVDPLETLFKPDPAEIQRIGWFSCDELLQPDATQYVTPNFAGEWPRVMELIKKYL